MRFEREVRAVATVTHWNTIGIFDYGHTDDGAIQRRSEKDPDRRYPDALTLDKALAGCKCANQ
jgi:serine/threonine-protein kinase